MSGTLFIPHHVVGDLTMGCSMNRLRMMSGICHLTITIEAISGLSVSMMTISTDHIPRFGISVSVSFSFGNRGGKKT